MDWIFNSEIWIALFTLTALEIVLGVDNIIFISILVGRLPEAQRQRARVIGLGLAMFTRIALLLSLAWVMTLTDPVFTAMLSVTTYTPDAAKWSAKLANRQGQTLTLTLMRATFSGEAIAAGPFIATPAPTFMVGQ